ncbi:7157_t:CDS:2 [Funneliformis geosporum]|uniref:7157_t:CDS:1 n=1 Tax=Funneliformis geosporum TaxID=1117311 RepID=A0A9W4SZQ7_9GLOM|nr:7157_t:CDS:2 [Funneliformis geosporum]
MIVSGTPENYVHIYTAFTLLLDASNQDHILAQYYVGACYLYGRGITKNEKLAFEYFKIVAEKDFAAGQLHLGYFYEYGICIEKDLKKVIYWQEKAANYGNLIAIKNLGVYYRNGIGVNITISCYGTLILPVGNIGNPIDHGDVNVIRIDIFWILLILLKLIQWYWKVEIYPRNREAQHPVQDLTI